MKGPAKSAALLSVLRWRVCKLLTQQCLSCLYNNIANLYCTSFKQKVWQLTLAEVCSTVLQRGVQYD